MLKEDTMNALTNLLQEDGCNSVVIHKYIRNFTDSCFRYVPITVFDTF